MKKLTGLQLNIAFLAEIWQYVVVSFIDKSNANDPYLLKVGFFAA